MKRIEKLYECGAKPTSPGGPGSGEWRCINGEWVWIEDVGLSSDEEAEES